MEILVQQAKKAPLTNAGYHPLLLETNVGDIGCHYYEAEHATSAVICVGGVGGGFDSPANGLYHKLCASLLDTGSSSLRIQYRDPLDLQESVFDVLVGAAYLDSLGIERLALVGHSFGGAVVIRAGAFYPMVSTVVALATQSYGAEEAAQLQGKSSLYIHGTADEILPSSCSVLVHKLAPEPKRLVLLEGADHGLTQKADDVYQLVYDWVLKSFTETENH